MTLKNLDSVLDRVQEGREILKRRAAEEEGWDRATPRILVDRDVILTALGTVSTRDGAPPTTTTRVLWTPPTSHFEWHKIPDDPTDARPKRDHKSIVERTWDRLCSFPGCKQPARAQRSGGPCWAHERQQKLGQELHPLRVIDPDRLCTIPGCNRKYFGLDLCHLHYDRERAEQKKSVEQKRELLKRLETLASKAAPVSNPE
jgi:hypothetical protein